MASASYRRELPQQAAFSAKISGQYTDLSVGEVHVEQRKRKDQRLEQTRRRVKPYRQRNKENEAPAVHGVYTVFASLLDALTKTETISKLKEILKQLKHGEVPLKANSTLNRSTVRGAV
ncbi:hypothetical protein WJX73_001692 [Symbiochloris irregularis]|uniref:Uncharacterized protein n=1 Tax=Symbiochloris irregularis TaxID=706552 RepID=A0AAW1P4Y7_9CHLO